MEKGPKKINPAELLLANDHIKKVINPEPEILTYQGELIDQQFKKVLIVSKIRPEMKKHLEESFIDYLKAPIIIDDFKDDRDRNELENNIPELTEEASKLYKSNRLRISNIRHILSFADLLMYCPVLDDMQKEDIKEQMKNLWQEVADRSDENERADNFKQYDRMSIQYKVAITAKAAELARNVCIDMIEFQNKSK